MSVGQPDATSVSLRKHVCSLEDEWNFARMRAPCPPACVKDSQSYQHHPQFCPFPFPASWQVQRVLRKAPLEMQTTEYDRESLGHNGLE